MEPQVKVKFQAILTIKEALEAVKRNGYALQYVLSFDLFRKIAVILSIETE